MTASENGNKVEYLGDGVYAEFDGFGVWLLANSHTNPTDRIYLEPGILGILVALMEKSQEEE